MKTAALLAALLFAGPRFAPGEADDVAVAGTVRSSEGAPIEGARVASQPGGPSSKTTTDASGRFLLRDAGGASLRVEADGFEPALVPVRPSEEISVWLRPIGVAAAVTVTASRTPREVRDTPASVVVLSSDDLAVSAAPASDDALRSVAGFSLFRRSGSRTSNPTTQGVSLRGTGASGASRAAVLEDGVPLNDPFGGWVYWGRVPLASLDRAEVVRGGASELYGSPALGGAIQLVRRAPADAPALSADVFAGSERARDAGLFASYRRGLYGAALAGEVFSTEGYVPTAPRERGPVDSGASSRHGTADLTVERREAGSRIFLRGSLFDESRVNGTDLQTNDVRLSEGTAGAEGVAGATGAATWTVRAYGSTQRFHQTFTSIAADRSSERILRFQTVPADAVGTSAQLARTLGDHLLVAGAEARRVKGESREEVPGTPASFLTAGGRESSGALFVEDVFRAGSEWTLTAGVRWDAWSDDDARRATSGGTTAGTVTRFGRRSETAWSPRISALYRASGVFSVAASSYRSFRAPTLNELYRSFRVGNVSTAANEDLSPERSTGGELAIAADLPGSRFHGRAAVFWMEIDDAIGNRTLTVTPTVINRRRENLGTVRARGAEADVQARFYPWSIRAGYLYADSSVLSAPSAPDLAGLRIPQVPRHQATLRVEYRQGGGVAALQARAAGRQFEDDENRLPLRSFWTADLFFSLALSRVIEPYVAVENVFDRDVETGRTPVTTLGAPRQLRIGVRVRR
ncbi:MAG: TonB-dependent receptor [Acidobacteria bacterium]|nr:TonB-dependent receptor [Acidobacteriota bacterium]